MAGPTGGTDARGLLELARSLGVDAVGVASAEPFNEARDALIDRQSSGLSGGMQFTYRHPEQCSDPSQAVPGARSILVAAMSYRHRPYRSRSSASRAEVGIPGTGPLAKVASVAWSDNYGRLRGALDVIADHLRGDGWSARVFVDENSLVDKPAAHRAGIGWWGKNSLLLNASLGSWFVIGSIVTDAPLEPTDAATDDGCGSCTVCIASCPTSAIVAPGVIDARRCLSWLLQRAGVFPFEFRESLGDRLYGCDDCQVSCPINRSAPLAIDHEPDSRSSPVVEDLCEVLALGDDEILDRFGGWYVPERDPAYVRRNSLVVLGNVAPVGYDRSDRAIREASGDSRAIVRAHAVWAASRLGLKHVIASLGDDTDPLVRAELDAVHAGLVRARA